MKEDTQNGFAYADQEHFYGDFPTAHIDARYQNGQFYDWETGKEVILKAKAPVRLVVRRMDIPEADRKRFHATAKKVLGQDTMLRFCLSCKPGTIHYVERTFWVRLLEDLAFEKKGSKPARAMSVQCEVYDRLNEYGQQGLPIFVANSLNQAYFQASVRYRPEARAHTVNIYKKFYINGTDRTLESLRF